MPDHSQESGTLPRGSAALPPTPQANPATANGEEVTQRNAGEPFNEATLRSEIVKVWGEYGAHAEVYDALLRAAGVGGVVRSDEPHIIGEGQCRIGLAAPVVERRQRRAGDGRDRDPAAQRVPEGAGSTPVRRSLPTRSEIGCDTCGWPNRPERTPADDCPLFGDPSHDSLDCSDCWGICDASCDGCSRPVRLSPSGRTADNGAERSAAGARSVPTVREVPNPMYQGEGQA